MPISNSIVLLGGPQNTAVVPFSYGDATPKPIAAIAAGRSVLTAVVVILVPFNGEGAALQLGDSAQLDRLMNSSQVEPTYAAEYESNPAHTYSTATEVLLTISPGDGCIQGTGYVLLEVE